MIGLNQQITSGLYHHSPPQRHRLLVYPATVTRFLYYVCPSKPITTNPLFAIVCIPPTCVSVHSCRVLGRIRVQVSARVCVHACAVACSCALRLLDHACARVCACRHVHACWGVRAAYTIANNPSLSLCHVPQNSEWPISLWGMCHDETLFPAQKPLPLSQW